MVLLVSCTTIPAKDAVIRLFDPFLDEQEAYQMFTELYQFTPWRQDHIRLYGREVTIPRLQAWYGDRDCNYSYSGIMLHPLEWTPLLLKIKQRIEQTVGAPFNSVLINLYRHGQDSNGWHADNEPELGKEPVIASLSLGAVRRFRLRKNSDRGKTMSLDLNPGSLLVMAGTTQQCWQHCVPKTARQVEPRINLTFRHISDDRFSRSRTSNKRS